MKRSILKTAAFILLMLAGCSKDESINDTSENIQLKKGRSITLGAVSVYFVGNSIKDGNFFPLALLNDGSRILKNGMCSGSISGYGKINPTLSNYSFTIPVARDNKDYLLNNRELKYDYVIDGRGRVSLNTRDYFDFTIKQAIYSPVNYKAGDQGLLVGETEFHGALLGCPIMYDGVVQGEAKITFGAGKFKNFPGTILEVYRNGNAKGIDRNTGEMNLIFYLR